MKTKTFDCVKMKRMGGELVQKRIEGKSISQQLDFWKKGTKDLKIQQKNKKKNSN